MFSCEFYEVFKSTFFIENLRTSASEVHTKWLEFVIFKRLSYCFEGTIGFDEKASFASRSESRLIRWYNEPGDITKKFR